jgi:hypothetical protein
MSRKGKIDWEYFVWAVAIAVSIIAFWIFIFIAVYKGVS